MLEGHLAALQLVIIVAELSLIKENTLVMLVRLKHWPFP